MGLHTFHLNLATGVRWTSRAVAIFAVIGYLAEWFWPPAGRDYLRLAWQSLLIWARGGAPAASVPPAVWPRPSVTLWLPPLGAVVAVLLVWLLLWARQIRRRAPEPMESRRGAEIVDADELAEKIARDK